MRLDIGLESYDIAPNTETNGQKRRINLFMADIQYTVFVALLPTTYNSRQVPQADFTKDSAHGSANGTDREILCMAFVPADEPLLASAGNDCIVRCWSLAKRTCTLLATLVVSKTGDVLGMAPCREKVCLCMCLMSVAHAPGSYKHPTWRHDFSIRYRTMRGLLNSRKLVARPSAVVYWW